MVEQKPDAGLKKVPVRYEPPLPRPQVDLSTYGTCRRYGTLKRLIASRGQENLPLAGFARIVLGTTEVSIDGEVKTLSWSGKPEDIKYYQVRPSGSYLPYNPNQN